MSGPPVRLRPRPRERRKRSPGPLMASLRNDRECCYRVGQPTKSHQPFATKQTRRLAQVSAAGLARYDMNNPPDQDDGPRHVRESLNVIQLELFSEQEMRRLERSKRNHPA